MNAFILGIVSLLTVNFYSLQFQDIDGNTVNLSSFQGKKLLLVNIAVSDSFMIKQIAALQKLQIQFGDSLAIIVFPSNSFGNANVADSSIKRICQIDCAATFTIASKVEVAGANAHPVFSWLADSTQNRFMNGPVQKDFQKFLIDREGKLVGILSSKIQPTSSVMINNIKAIN